MLVLALDTSSSVGSTAILRDQAILGETVSSSDQPYSITFFDDLNRLLAQASVAMPQIDLFAAGAGPGSFTGLRVGLTAVKAWAECFSKPVVAVSCLEALASKIVIPQPAAGGIIASILDARRGQIFGCIYRSSPDTGRLTPMTDELVCTANEFITLAEPLVLGARTPPEAGIESEVVFVTSTPDLIQPALETSVLKSVQIVEVSRELASAIGRVGYAKALRGEFVDAAALDANYVLRPDAERKWKDKQPNEPT